MHEEAENPAGPPVDGEKPCDNVIEIVHRFLRPMETSQSDIGTCNPHSCRQLPCISLHYFMYIKVTDRRVSPDRVTTRNRA